MIVEEGSFAKLRLFQEYQEMCKKQGIKPTTNSAFGKLVHAAFPGVQCNRKGPRGNAKHHYKNLAPRPHPSEMSEDSKQKVSFSVDDVENEEPESEEESEDSSDFSDEDESDESEDNSDSSSSSESSGSDSQPSPTTAKAPSVVSIVPGTAFPPVPLTRTNLCSTPIHDYTVPVHAGAQPATRLVTPRAVAAVRSGVNPYAPPSMALRPQPVYSASFVPAYGVPAAQQPQHQPSFPQHQPPCGPVGPAAVLTASTNSRFTPFQATAAPVASSQPAAFGAYPPPVLGSPTALETPLVDELTHFAGWPLDIPENNNSCAFAPLGPALAYTPGGSSPSSTSPASFFKPLVNTESYNFLRYKQHQRNRKQRKQQFLMQQLEQLQQDKKATDNRQCISPSADVDHSVPLDDEFWDWMSEVVQNDPVGAGRTAPVPQVGSVQNRVAVSSGVPLGPAGFGQSCPSGPSGADWENDFGSVADLERFLNNP